MKVALTLVVALLFFGCSAAKEVELVREVEGANVSLILASKTYSHATTTITVTVDDSLVATQPLAKLKEGPKQYRLRFEPGHHKLIARANTGRTKEIFPIFVHEDAESLTLTYTCTCSGSAHDEAIAHFILEQSESSQ